MLADARVTAVAIILSLGGLANLILVLCLAHTWKYWRQVKWYVVMLAIGNWLQIIFTFGIDLNVHLSGSWFGTTTSCRVLQFFSTLGRGVPNMAVAALSVHLLLTLRTGCQGSRLRNGLVLGLFFLLSLPLPFSRIPLLEAVSAGGDIRYCTETLETKEQWFQYVLGIGIATAYFPVFVFLTCGIAAVIVYITSSNASTKSDVSLSDFAITGLLGGVMMACCLPIRIFEQILTSRQILFVSQVVKIYSGLSYLEYCGVILSAVFTVIFAYVHAFRNRGEGYVPPGGHAAYGERQRLVN